MKTYLTILSFLLLLVVLSACSDDPREFTNYEAGEYKGKHDPFLAEGQHDLDDRFMLVQADR